MKKWLLAAFLLILIAIPMVFADSAPVIANLIISKNKIDSGQYVKFQIVAFDDTDTELAYEWDFGDGTSTIGQEVYHSYRIDPKLNQQTFTAKITVKDSQGNQITQSSPIQVNQADYLIEILEPKIIEQYDKTEPLIVKVLVTDLTGEPLSDSAVKFVKAKMSEDVQEIELERGENGVYIGTIENTLTLASQSFLIVKSNANAKGKITFYDTAVQVNFESLEFVPIIETNPKKILEGSVLRSFKISLYYPAEKIVKNADLEVKFNNNPVEFEREGDIFVFKNIETAISATQPGIVQIINAEDKHGNKLENYTHIIKISTETTAEFAIELEEPKPNTKKARNQELVFVVNIPTEYHPDVKDISVKLLSAEGKELRNLEWNPDDEYFTTTYFIPENYDGTLITFKLSVLHAKSEARREITVSFVVTEKYVVEIEKATDRELYIDFFYPDGTTRIEADLFKATIKYDEIEEEIIFEKYESGKFKGKFPRALASGENQLTIQLQEPFGTNTIEETITIPPNYFLWFIYLVGGAIILYAGGKFGKKAIKDLTKKIETIDSLKTEKRQLLDNLKKIKYMFYKRTISEGEYQNKSNLLNARIKGIDSTLQRLQNTKARKAAPKIETLEDRIMRKRRALSRLIPETQLSSQDKLSNLETLARKKHMKQEQETKHKKSRAGLSEEDAKEVERLVNLLLPLKGKFDRKEVEKSLLGEGTSPKLIKIVMQEIYS